MTRQKRAREIPSTTGENKMCELPKPKEQGRTNVLATHVVVSDLAYVLAHLMSAGTGKRMTRAHTNKV